MARLQYGVIPDLEKRLEQAEVTDDAEQLNPSIRSKVTEVEIAEVVKATTGIPVAKMLQGDREKTIAYGRSFLTSTVWLGKM